MAKGAFGKSGGGAEGMKSKLIDSAMSAKMIGKSGGKLAGSGRGRRKSHVGNKSGGKY